MMLFRCVVLSLSLLSVNVFSVENEVDFNDEVVVVDDLLLPESSDLLDYAVAGGNNLGGSAFVKYKAFLNESDQERKRRLNSDIIVGSAANNDYRFIYAVMSMYDENVVGTGVNHIDVLSDLISRFDYLKAYSYLGNSYIIEGDVERGLSILVKGSDLGDSRSSYLLGVYYRDGLYVEQSYYYAIESFSKINRTNYFHKALYEIAVIKDLLGESEDSFKYYKLAASKGNYKSCYNLVGLYRGDYRYLDSDGKLLLESIRCSVEGGYSEHKFDLAEYYYSGFLIDVNIKMAANLYGEYYDYAIENKIDLDFNKIHKIAVAKMRVADLSAISLFVKASSMGSPDSSYVMGKIYENGSGLDVDLESSMRYYVLSKSLGRENVDVDINRVGNLLNVDLNN